VDNASVYTTTRTAVLDLVGGLGPDELARPVAALPGWTVRDTVAHLAGVCADTLDGRTEGGGSPAWTARQLAERADRSGQPPVEVGAPPGPLVGDLRQSPAGTLSLEWLTWHRYDRNFTQKLTGMLGLYDQAGFGPIRTSEILYEHLWDIDNRLSVRYGAGRLLHAYDGRQTGRNFLNLALVVRFG